MMTDDTIIGIIAAAIIAIVVGGVIYYKTKKDTRKTQKELEDRLTDKMVDTANASKRVGNGGTVAKHDDKIIAAHVRHIQEPPIHITESVSVKVRRWHTDPNGSETSPITGERGYYTDE